MLPEAGVLASTLSVSSCPNFEAEEAEAQIEVRNSEIKDLSPVQPGGAAQTWAAWDGIATERPAI